ncbi:hypothetical protein ASU33_19695 [Solirubrum puertoriconensis]|uniref:Uncharacterized protein n=1 Tax=Solirubrum puertoriconensis TaxID=1751427 RepID=A0A9X0L5W7_SOLP1|nr:hypothetical protein ASU33_19695 [Solirubrum puertoriconensis]
MEPKPRSSSAFKILALDGTVQVFQFLRNFGRGRLFGGRSVPQLLVSEASDQVGALLVLLLTPRQRTRPALRPGVPKLVFGPESAGPS